MKLLQRALVFSALALLTTCERDPAQAGHHGGPGARLLTVNPSMLVAGQGGGVVTVSATGFPANKPIQVWFDTNHNGLFDANESTTLAPIGGPPNVNTVMSDGAGAFTSTFNFSADVAAGSYAILAGLCDPAPPADACFGISGTATAPVTITFGVSHSRFGSGSMVTVTGIGFPVSTGISVWYDTNPTGSLTAGSSSVSVTTDGSGAFSTPLLVDAAPAIDSLFALLTGHAGVATLGTFFIHAGPSTTPQQTLAVDIGSCWFNECLIYDSFGNAADTMCLFGNSPHDSFTYFADCKSLDVNYTNPTGYNFANTGPTFAGAGVLAAMLNDLGPPGTACAQLTAAIANAEITYGNSVPDKVSLLAIACGTGLTPPLALGAYVLGVELSGHSVPDKVVMFAAVAAINPAAVPAGG